MIIDNVIVGNKVKIRTILESDVNDIYVDWMNDYETNKYMETRWNIQNKYTILEFVKSIRESKNQILFAILDVKNSKHIGNIKLGPINNIYRFADISFFLGEKDYYGKGCMREAVALVCNYAFNNLHLHRIQAGFIDGNNASKQVLEANGFKQEGIFIDKNKICNEWKNVYQYSLINNGDNK